MSIHLVERIVAQRGGEGKGGTLEVLVKWAGFSSKENSWEPAENIQINLQTRPPSFGPCNLSAFVRHRFQHKDDGDSDGGDGGDDPSVQPAKTKGTSSSRFRGVTWSKSDRIWKAYIYVGGKQISLGSHHSEEQAALAHDKAARYRTGPGRVVNFPVPGSDERQAVKKRK